MVTSNLKFEDSSSRRKAVVCDSVLYILRVAFSYLNKLTSHSALRSSAGIWLIPRISIESTVSPNMYLLGYLRLRSISCMEE